MNMKVQKHQQLQGYSVFIPDFSPSRSRVFAASWDDGLAVRPPLRDVAFDLDNGGGNGLQLQCRRGVRPFQAVVLLLVAPRGVWARRFVKQVEVGLVQTAAVRLLHALPGLQYLDVGLVAANLRGDETRISR